MNKVYSLVNEKILESLKQGYIPWQKPWSVSNGFSGIFHRNAVTGKPYKGANVWLLSLACNRYPEYKRLWITYKQARQLRGFIYKQAKPQMVIYWSMFIKRNGKLVKVNVEDLPKDPEDLKDLDLVPVLRYYTVFNIVDLGPDSLRESIIKKYNDLAQKTNKKIKPIERAQKIIDKYKDRPPIFEDSQKAYYSPSNDEIHIPPRDCFISSEEYYSTLYHECVHSTGHQKRLNRFDNGDYSHKAYSLEELVAEIGCCYLCNIAQIDTEAVFKNSTAYIQSWYKALSEHPKWFIIASSRAQKAVDYILNGKKDN